jgi:hypothetical protein
MNPIPRESQRIAETEEVRDEAVRAEHIGGTAIEEQYRAVRDAVVDEPPDVAVLERESREAIDEELPWKRRFDPVFGYFKDRMGIDPHDVPFYYELAVRSADGGEKDAPRCQQFTNFHDLRTALTEEDKRGTPLVALKLPPEFLKKLHPGREFQKFADGFGILKEQLEHQPKNVTDMYAAAEASGELARLKAEDAEERGAGREMPRVEDQQNAVQTELAIHQEVERAMDAGTERELDPAARERSLRSELDMRRKLYAGGESGMREWGKKHKGFWERRKLERAVKRATLGAILAPGDAELPTKAGVSVDALHDVALRENIFRDRLREQGITGADDIRQIYGLEQRKVEYEYAKAALARVARERETKRLQDAGVSPEDALRQANAGIFEELVIKESLSLNRLKLETWPVAERGRMRRAWEDWRAWYGKLGVWGRVGVGIGTGVGVAGAGMLLGVFGAGAAAAYAGRRTFGALGGALGSMGGKELAERFMSRRTQAEIERLDAHERALRERAELSGDGSLEQAVASLRGLSEEHRKIMDARYGIAKRTAIAKAVGAAVGGIALGAGTSYAAAHLGGLDTLMPTARPSTERVPLEPKPSAEVAQNIAEAPKPRSESAFSPEVAPTPDAVAERVHEKLFLHAEQPPIGAQLEELATVKKGEGAWGPVRRQLRAQLTAHPEQFGLKPEDLQNGVKVQHALNSRTTQILKELGFIGPKGTTQLGIHPPGTKIFLTENGGLRIEGGHAYDYGMHARPADVAESVSHGAGAAQEGVTVIRHEPAPAEALSPVPEPPEDVRGAGVAESVSSERASTKLSFLGDVLQPAEGSAPTAAEVAAAAQETEALRAAIVQEATAHYADKYQALSPLGRECFVHAVERQVEISNGRMLPAQVLRNMEMFDMDYELAQTVGQISPQELAALEELGFTKEGLFTVNLHGDFGYASTLRDMHVRDVLKNLTADGAVDRGKLGASVNFFLGGGRGSALVIGERHLALAEKLAEYIDHGGKPDATVAEALVAPR